MASQLVASLDSQSPLSEFPEPVQKPSMGMPLVDRINLLLGGLQKSNDRERYLEILSLLYYSIAQNHSGENRVELACSKVLDYVDWKHPDLYGFLQNPEKYTLTRHPTKDVLFRI